MLVISRTKSVAVILFISLILFSCGKKDVDPPEISIDSPTANTAFQLPATITIKGVVTDDNSLNNIKINLLDDNQAPISTEKNISTNSNEYFFEESFIVNEDYCLVVIIILMLKHLMQKII